MRITPLDVRKQEFRRSVRGFDCDEVRAFMTTLADEYEIVLVDNKQLREKLMSQEDKLGEYQTMERTLRDTLMTAEKLMQETRENANKEGELIIQEAKLKAKEVLQECRLRTEELRREIDGLRKEKEAYLGRFKSLAESQIHFIESHRNDFRELDQRLTTIVDSVAEGVAENASRAESEAVVDTIVEAMIHPEGIEDEYETRIAAPATTASIPTRQEEDIWRNYNPSVSAPAPSNQPAAPAAPESVAPQETGGNEAEAIADHASSNPDPVAETNHETPEGPSQESNQDQKQDQDEYEPIRI